MSMYVRQHLIESLQASNVFRAVFANVEYDILQFTSLQHLKNSVLSLLKILKYQSNIYP